MRYISVLLLALVVSTCTTENEPPVSDTTKTIHVDLDEAESSLRMSEFFSGLEYKPLRTPERRPIGRIRKIMPQDEQIAFYDEARKSVWVFTYDGEYVNEIEIPQGRGPGEIEHMNDVLFTKDGFIHALGAFKIVVYDMEGEFVEETEFTFYVYKFIYNQETDEYIGYASNSLNLKLNNEHSGHNLIVFNKKGTITKSLVPIPNGRGHIGYHIPNNFPIYQNNQLFFPHLSDTVYTLQPAGALPRYILDYGEDAIPEEVFDRRKNYSDVVYEWVDFMKEEIDAKDYISHLTFFNETDIYIHLRISTREDQYNVLYNKETGETTVGPNRFTNDIDYAYVPFMYESSDKAIYTIIESHDLLRKLNDMYENDPEKYADPKMRPIIDLAHSLDENSNPILQIATFKTGE